jgi:CDP-diacylglycerol--serine O-phosphatidyltransferase
MIDDPNRPAWAANFFVGMPAPGGAIAVLLPIYLTFLGMPRFGLLAPLVLLYTLAIAILMVSRLPVFSGKRVGKRVAPELVPPLFVLVVAFFALLIAYPWFVLAIGTVAYLASLPFGVIAYRKHERGDAAAKPAQPSAVPPTAAPTETQSTLPAAPPDETERPSRLN